MFVLNQYQLIDFGGGRRLERFGPLVLDRPCPAAENLRRADRAAWQTADARFERDDGPDGQWICRGELPERWAVDHGSFKLELRLTPAGQLGLFPEQAANWDWIGEQLRQGDRAAKVLNLFAYTGGSTLAAAAAGAEVVHLDAARNMLAWARRNAELSGMAHKPIRWIAEDAMKFVERELKRGNRYDAVILDPPSYGHGPHGEVWRLAKHLPQLLQTCGRLTAGRLQFMLLSCHTPGFDAANLGTMVTDALGPGGDVDAEGLTLRTAAGRSLSCGVAVRWRSRA